jgi:quercetin dioxygenase-like cupin family protein
MAEKEMPTIHRFITDHNSDGKAIFNQQVEEVLPWKTVHDDVRFGLGYATNQTPVDLSNDVGKYQQYQTDLPGIMIPGGTVLRYVDMPPGMLSPMHRTVSLDYGVVLEGEVELVLDSGEARTMKRGDVAIQRGTNHAWRNMNPDKWARMMYILMEAKPVSIDGKALEEDYGGMKGVRASKA